MKDIIKLIYVKDGNEYTTDIDRTVLFEQMEYFAKWYLVDGTNYNDRIALLKTSLSLDALIKLFGIFLNTIVRKL